MTEAPDISGILLDTPLYVSALRRGDLSVLAMRRSSLPGTQPTVPVWLSAVVLEELYAGAHDWRTKKLCVSLERDFDKAGRLLVPLRADWSTCGQVLSLLGQKYGYEQIGRARLTNDTLIAVSAGRRG